MADNFLQLVDELKGRLQDLAGIYRNLRQEKAQQVQQANRNATNNTPSNATPPPPAPQSANVLSGSVGQGGDNREADVRKVQNLLNRHGIRPALAEDGQIGPKTIAAIRRFQEIKLGSADGLVEPGKRTWRALLGEQFSPPNNNNNNTNPTPNPQPNNGGNNRTQQLLSSIQTTGAGSHTARQDGLHNRGLTGVQISQTMARTDSARINNYKHLFVKVGKEQGVSPAILAAIASRETRGREVVGDHGNGFGIIQVDRRYHPEKVAKIVAKQGEARVEESIRQGAIVFKDSLAEIKRKFPQWNEAQQIKGALAAYNAGVSTVQTYEGMDRGTTGDDYSSDVWARAQFFAGNGFTEGEENPQNPNPNPNPQTGNSLSGSVGRGGQNAQADIRLVQTQLRRHGFNNVTVNGNLDQATSEAIVRFQEAKLGSSDGLIEPGKRTWQALLGPVTPITPPNNGGGTTPPNTGQAPRTRGQSNVSRERANALHAQSSNVFSPVGGTVGTIGRAQNNAGDVRIIQELLGFPTTGTVDARLVEAIREFQTFIGLPVDGVIAPMGNTIRYLVSYQKALNDIPDVPAGQGFLITHPEPGGRFTSPFGMRKLSSDARARMHNGVDIAKGTGTPILAIAPGIAKQTSYSGFSVEIDHQNGYKSIYAHLSAIGTLGQVNAGTVIGREGGSGPRGQNQFASHLHFEIRIGNTPVDPMPFIKGAKLFPNRR